jgi:hypothetical protein
MSSEVGRLRLRDLPDLSCRHSERLHLVLYRAELDESGAVVDLQALPRDAIRPPLDTIAMPLRAMAGEYVAPDAAAVWATLEDPGSDARGWLEALAHGWTLAGLTVEAEEARRDLSDWLQECPTDEP